MSNLHVRYLLIGGGLTSSSAAEAIRGRDAEGSILLVGQEITRPYNRPPLSKDFLRQHKSHEELFTHKPGWFAANHIELRTGRRAVQLDTSRKVVMLDDGQEVVFDKLLLATGMSPRHLDIPGANLPNVFYVRTLNDVERLHHSVQKALAEGRPHAAGRGRACVVGGGVLGVELAATLKQMGLAIDLVVDKPTVWAKFSGETTGRFMNRYLEAHGITLHVNAEPIRLDGDGRAQHVVLMDGQSIPCDLVVAAVGATANKDLLRATPIAAEKAILVDDHCRTSVSDIYAAGDCAALFDPLFGKHRIMDHWDNAKVTGALAGRNMAGADERYDTVNYFFSDVFELSLSAWGESRHVDHRLVRGLPKVDQPNFVEFGVSGDGRISQAIAMGPAGEDESLKALVGKRFSIAGHEESLRDPSFDLKTLVG